MPHRITCSWCETHLRVDDAITAAYVTCPNCLARLPNPGAPAAVAETPTPDAPIPSGPRPTRGAKWGDPTLTLEEDTQRDSKSVGCGLMFLAGLGALGVLQMVIPLAFALNDPNTRSNDALALTIGVVITLAFVALIATGIMLFRTRKHPGERTVGRVVVGTLALIGALMLSGIALMVVFFLVCVVALIGGGRF